ncbi:MAG: sigma-70 family RNA polymerase sigma factor [Gemmatimonadetes bacterium]|nr:sigma-70 family RNA polymerase sigma factor [Gemmatimonadota bacterium]NNL31385.1 sigma-70 family RNA polymerase sigma factor [Gemmatimonadota bacterium]
MNEAPDVTRILQDAARGRREAVDRAIPLIYDELRRIAQGHLARERPDHTLTTTALVHEAYLRLIDIREVDWQDRAHFFALAARQMRRILIDHARRAGREKRGGGAVMVSLDEATDLPVLRPESLIRLDEALERLEATSERQCRVVECRCFVGLSVKETAEVLDTSSTTVKRDWAFARAWLNRELADEASSADA